MKNNLLALILLVAGVMLNAQPNLNLESFANGFTRLVDVTHCGDDRLFVVERDGQINIIQNDGTVLPTPFLDIDSRVNSGQSEQGLLGLAFHPDYLNNGYFYVYYTDNSEDTQVSRFSVSDSDPNVADPDSEVLILDEGQPFWNHNGGCIKFGSDGYLYISLGDGGSGGDPQGNGQKRTTFLGKMLRIDVDNGDPYSIPADNPFINDDQTLDEIWSLGLRNVWRFSFDAVTNDMWMADVGQNEWEEIDFQPANSQGGENYGWRCYEGDHSFQLGGCDPASTMVFPVFEYSNSFQQGCSVTGGFVYRGCEMPGLYGHYIFADYCSGKFWSITPVNGSWTTVELANLTNNNFSGFGEDKDGELYVVGHGNGTIARITSDSGILSGTDINCGDDTDGAISFTIPTDQLAMVNWEDGSSETERFNLGAGTYQVEVTTTNGCVFTDSVTLAAGEPYLAVPTLSFDAGELTTDVTASSYQWYLNGDPINGATDATYLPNESGNYSVEVFNSNGCGTSSADISITVTITLAELGLEKISITPNPFSSKLQVEVKSAESMEALFQLTDAKGQVVFEQQQLLNGLFVEQFDLQDVPAGVYYFIVKNENGEWSERVIKQ